MMSVIFFLTAFTFLDNISTTTLRPGIPNLREMLATMKLYCEYPGPYVIREELKEAWAEVMKGENKHPPGDMSDLQKFLKLVAFEFNFGDKAYVFMTVEEAWKYYMIVFGKEYSAEEMVMRKEIFKKNKKHVDDHNKLFYHGKVPYAIKLTHLSDRTSKELEKMRGFGPHNPTGHRHPKLGPLLHNDTKYYHHDPNFKAPASVNGRMEDYITPVKFQGDCASCYAFAGIGALEAYHQKKTGKMISLSVQNILDCTWHIGNDGCNGGFFRTVFEAARSMGIEPDDYYPYTMNASHDCKWKKEHAVVAFDDDLYTVVQGNELALEQAVAKFGSVGAVIGETGDFYAYAFGIFNPSSCGPASHSVLIVGYGRDPKYGDYWTVKNSYGEWWGEHGYMRIARNKGNVCHVASNIIFPAKL